MSALTARTAAERLIDRMGIVSAPVPLDAVARELGLSIVHEDLGPDVSALLITEGKSSVIGVHSRHSRNRQRFSIAHEIGHFALRHQFEAGEHVHVDEGRFVSERSIRASAGVDPKEIEANHFAAALLMPSKLIRAHVALVGKGPLMEEEISQLARDFDVSEQAMTIRLGTLSLI